VLDPRALAELLPDFAKTAPLDAPVTDDAAYFMTERRAWKLPITPPPLRNHGNYIVSLNKLAKWLGGLVEQAGVNVFTQFAGAQLIYEGDAIAGVITEDKGIDKDGKPKDNFTPGYELRARITVLAEENQPPVPFTHASSAPPTWRPAASPRSWRTASTSSSSPYMPGWQ